jgi:seryl-tRNA synthetase
MHDIKFIRANPEAFDKGLARRGLSEKAKEILEIDKRQREMKTRLQSLQNQKNELANSIGVVKGKPTDEQLVIIKKSQSFGRDIKDIEEQLPKVENQLKVILETLPNIPADDVPEGKDEHGNKEVRVVGSKPALTVNKPKLHDELGTALKLMDFDAAAKLSGARFVVLKGALARMERALANFMLDIHTNEFGYTEMVPPVLMRDWDDDKSALYGTGQLPKFKGDLFNCEYTLEIPLKDGQVKIDSSGNVQILDQDIQEQINEWKRNGHEFPELVISGKSGNVKRFTAHGHKYWLIPTAEVPLTNLVADSILDEDDLKANPIRMTAYTPCFRSEAGAAGKDTRGMIRQHQFSKVELVSIAHPDQSKAEHERMTNCAEEILKRLCLHYRTMLLCTGDMGFCSQKTYDLEVWMPGQNAFREISSCSNCGDFQARRMKARFKGKNSKETQFVHTLNGSGLAIGRTMVAIIENYQQADGSIAIPDKLKPYMGGMEKIAA